MRIPSGKRNGREKVRMRAFRRMGFGGRDKSPWTLRNTSLGLPRRLGVPLRSMVYDFLGTLSRLGFRFLDHNATLISKCQI